MKNLKQRVATASVTAVFAAGALLATHSTATAATLPDAGHTPTRVTVIADTTTAGPQVAQAVQYHGDAWVQGQLLTFNPWIGDQLSQFAHYDGPGHP
ncbi:hypothetical protein AB9Q10_27520 [Streptomyces krungchingensis]|uniref:hypothetical protein n=1 Tax=Streptomyces krungchingensis TaxID=1565034 RepID=UPI003CFB2B48